MWEGVSRLFPASPLSTVKGSHPEGGCLSTDCTRPGLWAGPTSEPELHTMAGEQA